MNLRSNGKSEQQAMVEQQQAREEDLANIQAAENGTDPSTNYVRTILDSELQDPTKDMLLNLLSRDWVLGNLTEAQEHDARNKAEVLKLKIEDMHPPSESHMQGRVRQYFYGGDSSERLTSLSAQDRLLIDELIETLKTRFGRGRDGFEREQQNTSINRAETDSEEETQSSDGWTGVF